MALYLDENTYKYVFLTYIRFHLNFISMKTILLPLFLFCFHYGFAQSKLMDCMVETNGSNSDLSVFLTDTVNFSGIEVKIGTTFDDSDLYNEQYEKASLPGDATLDNNTLFLPLGALSYTSAKYVWVKVMLLGGGYNEIKITTEE